MNISTINRVGIALLLVGSFMFVALPVYAQEATGGLVDEDAQAKADVLAEIEANKAGFAQELAARWEAEALERGNDETWLDMMVGMLSEQDAETLLSKSEAESYDDFIGIQTTSELVYYPLTPCRIVDTRFATRWGFQTPIPTNGTRSFDTIGNTSSQKDPTVGPANCGVPSAAAGVVINVTAIPLVNSSGWLTIWPFLNPRPNASLVNWDNSDSSEAIANAVTQSQCFGCTDQLNVYARYSAHFIVDVIGYFAAPTKTIPDQYIVSSGRRDLGTGTGSIFTANCPSGYRLSGVSGLVDLWTLDIEFIGARPARNNSIALVSGANSGTQGLCQFRNDSGAFRSNAVVCMAICLRQPGR
jgi:hypothetical protein